jgi:integrase
MSRKPLTRASNLSKDGKWRSFPDVPKLMQYVSTGSFYARAKIKGKIVRKSLRTKLWTAAQVRLIDFLKDQREKESETVGLTFKEALELYEKALINSTSMKPRSKEYRRLCIKKIMATWPGLGDRELKSIQADECREWAARVHESIASQYFNNTFDTLKLIIKAGIEECVRQGGRELKNPVTRIERSRIVARQLNLPERSEFKALVENVRKKSGGWGPRVGDLIEFLTYSGMRAFTEAQWVTWEDVDWKRKEIIVRGDPEIGAKNREVRRIPIVADMEDLLERLQSKGKATGKILEIRGADKSLRRARVELEIARIRLHDLRHLFATRCIESGVDIPTVSRWLGHKDGGALAMKTYGHLRNKHSQEMAKKVKF